MARPPRRLTAALDREGPILCLSLAQARTPDIVLVAAAAGFDAVYVDLEHSVTPLDVTSMLCTAALGAGIIPFVRVASSEPAMITRVLDGGALGIIVPHIESARHVQQVVDVCRFPPTGARALYGATPVTGYRSLPADQLAEALDADVVVVPMIESAAGVANAKEIAGVDGVDILLVGLHDLSADLGVPGQIDHPQVRAALLSVADSCVAHGRRIGVAGTSDPGLLADLSTQGLGFVSAGTDVGLLQAAATARVAELRGFLDPQKDRSS